MHKHLKFRNIGIYSTVLQIQGRIIWSRGFSYFFSRSHQTGKFDHVFVPLHFFTQDSLQHFVLPALMGVSKLPDTSFGLRQRQVVPFSYLPSTQFFLPNLHFAGSAFSKLIRGLISSRIFFIHAVHWFNTRFSQVYVSETTWTVDDAKDCLTRLHCDLLHILRNITPMRILRKK